MKPFLQRALIAVAALIPIGATTSISHARQQEMATTPAWFEGRMIDLAVGWEGATACHVDDAGAVCFRTEKEMNISLQPDAQGNDLSESVTALLAACGSPLRLYGGISYTGAVLALSQRGTAVNLSAYSFDNATTSYKVGSCDTNFYSGPSQSGSQYPGNTAAYAQSPTMLTGWNNFISSVFIN